MKISLSVKPNSRISAIEKLADGSLAVHLKSAPVDGKANEELIRVLSKHFHVPQQSIIIRKGGSGKKKVVEILGK